MKELRSLDLQLAGESGKHHPFNKQEGEAGTDWFRGFIVAYVEVRLLL
jgi:hypothetical protein